MEYKRKIIVYGDYFAEFYDKQISSVKNKINYVLNLVRVEEHIPCRFFRNIDTVSGLFEIRIEMEGNIFEYSAVSTKENWLFFLMAFKRKLRKLRQKKLKRLPKL